MYVPLARKGGTSLKKVFWPVERYANCFARASPAPHNNRESRRWRGPAHSYRPRKYAPRCLTPGRPCHAIPLLKVPHGFRRPNAGNGPDPSEDFRWLRVSPAHARITCLATATSIRVRLSLLLTQCDSLDEAEVVPGDNGRRPPAHLMYVLTHQRPSRPTELAVVGSDFGPGSSIPFTGRPVPADSTPPFDGTGIRPSTSRSGSLRWILSSDPSRSRGSLVTTVVAQSARVARRMRMSRRRAGWILN